ncbi:CRISPR-associated helicase Cas3' [Aromatoleum toluvorans]|uniref:CRISPR-associated helicase Cas3 n=1 Tax=Aromatoleum toluvorans TaxID=92002 RepID=A0ABX1Q331_9RHOO|nr:CRISPR-associated helicase Cas3' [Aromatoleum toluvorans]NMG44766.1 CRISPR-associated helicase Cas3' [Aromatoleum toluvorans]
MSDPEYFRYWGKARPQDGDGAGYHLLPYHCLDVAAVGAVLLRKQRIILDRWFATTQLEPDQHDALAVFFLALHDLGKFARGFQNQVSFANATLVSPNPRYRYGNGIRHDTLGWVAWKSRIRQQIALPRLPAPKNSAWLTWLRATTGHHGVPPRETDGTLPIEPDFYFHEEDLVAAARFVADLAEFLLPEGLPEPDGSLKQALYDASWQLAGFAVLSDWVGSSQTCFPYLAEPLPLERYWHDHALPQAEKALEQIGLNLAQVAPFASAQALFSYLTPPTPLQQFAAETPLARGPQLILLEDVTGAGKTEAALIFAHRLMTSGQGSGLYFGLPTMATSNQMYRRVGTVYRRFFRPRPAPSLVLAHGARELVDDFSASILPVQPADRDYDSREATASALCTAWIADSNKKALLANVGVGTLDQALLAALPAQHQSLRLLGLQGKVLVADEVHAYDAYTGRLLQVLLEQHARQGGSAVLLSATLPAELRSILVGAFRRGLRTSCEDGEEEAAPYPLVTHVHEGGVSRTPVGTRPEVARRVQVRFLHDLDEVIRRIRGAAAAGQCVVWIRNTVDDARDAWERLRQTEGIDVARLTLFHSRYALADRLVIEDHVLDVLGKDSDSDSRHARIVVSSQVMEQSVDCDADVMISDLAPVDLLIQRAGRLHRHTRDASGNPSDIEGRPAPELIVLAPEFDADPAADWHRGPFPRASRVYADTGRLWLTQRILATTGAIVMPEGARTLIEAVYGPDAELDIPPGLQDASLKKQGEAIGDRTLANTNTLDFGQGYCQEAGRWDREEDKPTRLGDEDREFVLAVADASGLRPWAAGHAHPWAASAVKVPARRLDCLASEWIARFGSGIEALKQTHRFLKYADILPVECDGEVGHAEGLNLKGEKVEVHYDARLGLETKRAEK